MSMDWPPAACFHTIPLVLTEQMQRCLNTFLSEVGATLEDVQTGNLPSLDAEQLTITCE